MIINSRAASIRCQSFPHNKFQNASNTLNSKVVRTFALHRSGELAFAPSISATRGKRYPSPSISLNF